MSAVAEPMDSVSEVPDGWAIGPFSSLADYVNGRAFKPEDWGNAGLPIIRIAQITNPDSETNFYHGQVDPRNLIDTGDLIFSWSATLAVMKWSKGPAVLNQHLFKVTPTKNIDRDWLQFRLEASIPDLADEAHGTTMKHIRKGTLSSKTTLIPPFDEQRRIAEVLRSVDEAIAAAQKTLDCCTSLLATKRRATFRHLIVEHDDDAVRLRDICELGRGFAFKSEDYVDQGILNFRVTNVGKSLSDLGERRFLPTNFIDEYEEYVLTGGEIVLVMVGATVGKLGKVPSEVCPALLNQNMWTLTAKEPFDQELLWHLAHILIEEKVHGAQGGAYSFLTKKDFLEHRIGCFDVAEMKRAVANLTALETYIERLADQLRQHHILKTNLMADLLSGHVRVPA